MPARWRPGRTGCGRRNSRSRAPGHRSHRSSAPPPSSEPLIVIAGEATQCRWLPPPNTGPSKMPEFVLTECRGKVAVVTLSRQHALNAWHRPMREELMAELRRFEADPAVGAIVLTGAGEAFSAGQDLAESMEFDPDRAVEWIQEWETLYDLMRSLSKPFIAALNGVAAGSAFQVALLADFRIGHSGVRMGQPE